MSLQKFPSFFLDFSKRDMKGKNGHSYHFGRFTFDVAEQRLSDGQTQIPLTPKAFDVLSLLVENAGHLVEKDDLMKHVWPDSFVEEVNVARIVHTLRKSLGDDGNGSSFIETVPTKGYRFVANVEVSGNQAEKNDFKKAQMEVAATGSPTDEPTTSTETPAEVGRRRFYFVLAAVILLSFLVTGFWIANRSLRSRQSATLAGHSLNGEAYRNFQEGKFLVETRSPENYEKALEKFERAIELDPNYAEAYAGKADVRSAPSVGGRTNDDNASARAASKKALELNPDSAYAHTVNCRIMSTYDWEFEEAVAECQRAVALDPNDAGAHRELALALNVVGRSDEAVSEIDATIAISPTSDNKRARGLILYMARRYDDAIEQSQQLVATDPQYGDGYKWLMLAFAMKNDPANAFENLIKFEEALGASPEAIDAVSSAFATGGWPAAVRTSLSPGGIRTKRTGYVVADLLAQIGEKDQAFDAIEELRKVRALMMVNVPRDPMLDPIRDDPRYRAILSEMNLK